MTLRSASLIAPTLAALLSCASAYAQPAVDDEPEPVPAAVPTTSPPAWSPAPAAAPPRSAPDRLGWTRHWELTIIGAGLFTLGYVPTLAFGLREDAWRLDLPLVGPALEIQQMRNAWAPVRITAGFFLALDTVIQIGGTGLVIAGALVKRRPRPAPVGAPPWASGAGTAGR